MIARTHRRRMRELADAELLPQIGQPRDPVVMGAHGGPIVIRVRSNGRHLDYAGGVLGQRGSE